MPWRVRARAGTRGVAALIVGAVAVGGAWGVRAATEDKVSTAEAQGGPAATPVVVSKAQPPLVQVAIQLRAGALDDPADRLGRSVLCWHAAVRAAGARDRRAFAAFLAERGADLDVEVGQTTTVLRARGLRAHADELAALLADVLWRPRLDPADVEEARTQQVAGLDDLLDEPAALADDAIIRYALRGHPLGRPIDGTAATIAGLDPAACRAWLREVVTHAAADVGWSGAITQEEAAAIGSKHLAGLKGRRHGRVTRPGPWPAGDGRRLLLIDHPGQPTAHIALALRAPGVLSPVAAAVPLGDAIVGGAFTSRLSQQVRELRGWTYSIASSWLAGPEQGLWLLNWAPRNAVAARSLDLVMRQLELAAAQGATAAEIGFAQDYLRGSRRLALQTADAELGARLGALALGLDASWIDGFEARLAAVRDRDVAVAMAQTFSTAAVVVVVVGDARKLKPALEQAASGFAVEVIRRGEAPESTRGPGRTPAPTPAPTEAAPDDHDHGDEVGPDFGEDDAELPDAATPHATPPASTPDDDGGAGLAPPPRRRGRGA